MSVKMPAVLKRMPMRDLRELACRLDGDPSMNGRAIWHFAGPLFNQVNPCFIFMTCHAIWNEQPNEVIAGRTLAVRSMSSKPLQLLDLHIQETGNHALLA